MVQTCSAYGCKNRYHKDKEISFHKRCHMFCCFLKDSLNPGGATFALCIVLTPCKNCTRRHRFPLARPDICDKWVAAMRRNNFKPTKYSNICSQHFAKDCFKRECNNRVLKDHAVPSLFDLNLDIKECLEDPFPSEIHFPLSFPLTSDDVVEEVESEPVRSAPDTPGDTAVVSCDHNYTAEDSARQKKRIQQLEEQLELLRKKLKTTQQKCRRQERQLKSLRVSCKTVRTPRHAPSAFNEGYVILPKHIYRTLQGIE
ncbi:THAP domain-containing protein 1 isoform X2 [Phyllopteryx taeniolatus]|uniref:THAP domain-containing protein 1 isoform X2 n=1 Tax=Phyllopteryx taeniolatus TaxID=161469 RepID=UPI002AD55566|nr:THAP domain-containing protein 1 isoform X2 [Phyllopteryx taeniolatus]